MPAGGNQQLPKHCGRSLPGVPEAQGLSWLPTCLARDLISNHVLTGLSDGKRTEMAETRFKTSVFPFFPPSLFVYLFGFFSRGETPSNLISSFPPLNPFIVLSCLSELIALGRGFILNYIY